MLNIKKKNLRSLYSNINFINKLSKCSYFRHLCTQHLMLTWSATYHTVFAGTQLAPPVQGPIGGSVFLYKLLSFKLLKFAARLWFCVEMLILKCFLKLSFEVCILNHHRFQSLDFVKESLLGKRYNWNPKLHSLQN